MLLDDIDGTEATRHIRFSVNGTSYALDVSEANGKAFDEAITPFLKVARKVTRPSKIKGQSKEVSYAEIREWARERGYKLPGRGMVPRAIRDAYYSTISMTA